MGERVEYSRQYTFKTIVLCIREVDQAHSLVLSLYLQWHFFFIVCDFSWWHGACARGYVTGVADSIVLLLYNGPVDPSAFSFLPPFLMCAARAPLFSLGPLPCGCHSPSPTASPWAVELLPQKDVGVTLGGVGKTCCGKEWVASTSLHFCDDDDTIYMPIYKCVCRRMHTWYAYVYMRIVLMYNIYIHNIHITQSCPHI